MGDDYLWDRSGEPDPDVARLEGVLSTLKYAEKEGSFEPKAPVVPIARVRRRVWIPLSVVAGAAAAAAFLVLRSPAPRVEEARRMAPALTAGSAAIHAQDARDRAAFAVTRLAGAPRVASGSIAATGQLAVGEWLETDASSRARVAVASIGVVDVREGSRLKLSATGPDQHRLDLERGGISARVDAPPRLFVVGTPAATAVDLGCAYTLDVDERGAGVLRVTSGWVALEDGPRSSLVPAGASCLTRPGRGPGTPFFDDAPAPLREALARFDFEDGGAAALRAILAQARRRDALTVWHLLARAEERDRRAVHAKLAALSPPPAGVTEASVLRLDADALAAWRRSLFDMPITW
jgi:hypothetical protein